MSGRVLSSPEAHAAIGKLHNLIHGDLLAQINALNAQGEILSRPDVWDGNRAVQFRNDWPGVKSNLMRVKDSLEELRTQVEQINNNIMSAGGNT